MYVRPFISLSVRLSVASVHLCLFSLAFSRALVDSVIQCDLSYNIFHGAVDTNCEGVLIVWS